MTLAFQRPLTSREISDRQRKLQDIERRKMEYMRMQQRLADATYEAQRAVLSEELERGVRLPPGLRYVRYREVYYRVLGHPGIRAVRDFGNMVRGYAASTGLPVEEVRRRLLAD